MTEWLLPAEILDIGWGVGGGPKKRVSHLGSESLRSITPGIRPVLSIPPMV